MENAEAQVQRIDEGASCAACPAGEFNLCAGRTAKDQLAALLRPAVQTIPARRPICRAGEALDAIPIICKGWAASAMTLPDGRRLILSILLPGDIVSSALLIESEIRFSVEAVTDVEYRMFDRADLQTLFVRRPHLLADLSKIWIDEKNQADQLALELGRCSADERIARLILNLSKRLSARGLVQNQTMEFPLRHHQIADAMGLTVVHVSKVLSEFKRAGMIQMDNRSMTILDLPALRRVANVR